MLIVTLTSLANISRQQLKTSMIEKCSRTCEPCKIWSICALLNCVFVLFCKLIKCQWRLIKGLWTTIMRKVRWLYTKAPFSLFCTKLFVQNGGKLLSSWPEADKDVISSQNVERQDQHCCQKLAILAQTILELINLQISRCQHLGWHTHFNP